MLSSFWRRKNGRLVQRLNAAIEAGDRLSEAYNAPKPPRVAIDTSYVERKSHQPTIARQHDDTGCPPDPYAPVSERAHQSLRYDQDQVGPGLYDAGEPDVAHDYDGVSNDADLPPAPADATHAGAPYDVHDDADQSESQASLADPDALAEMELLKEALEQIELAEQREAEALEALQAAQRRAEDLEAAVAKEQEARRGAEAECANAHDAASAAAQEMELLRANAATNANETSARDKLEAKLMLEQAARREAEALREKACRALDDANEEIGVLRRTAKELASDKARTTERSVEDGEAEITKLRQQIAEMEAAAADIGEALAKSQQEAKTAQRAAEAAGKELNLMREAAAKTTDVKAELAQAKAHEEEAVTRAEDLSRRAVDLEARLTDIEREHTAALDHVAETARTAATEAADEIAALRLAAEHLANERAKEDSETRERENANRNLIDTLQSQVKDLQAALDAERETSAKAALKAGEEIEALRQAAEELAESKAQSDSHTEERTAEALREIEELRGKIAELEAANAAERDQAKTAIAEATQEIQSLRRAAQNATDEIAGLRLAAEHLADERAKEDSETRERENANRNLIDTLQSQVKDLQAALDAERETSAKAALKAGEKIEALRRAAEELAESKAQSDSHTEERTAEALREIEELRGKIAKLEAANAAERDQAKTAIAEATQEIQSLRRAAQDATHNERANEKLRDQLRKLQSRTQEMETALNEAEAARLSAEFDRENALKDVTEAGAKLAALRRGENQSSSPHVFDTASSTASQTASDEDTNSDGEITPDLGDTPEFPMVVSDDKAPDVEAASSEAEQAADEDVASNLTVYTCQLPEAQNSSEGSERRCREKRIPSRMPVTLWTESWGQPLSCFLVDKSSRGAKVEMRPDRIFGGNNRINVGDRLTLTFYYAQERTSVFCDVMWMNDNFLGLKYYGQFHTEFNKPCANQRRQFGAAK